MARLPEFEPIGLVTLITDFGERDHYVAAMKGVMLAIAAELRLVDLSHQIAPQDVDGAAWFARNSYPLFPAGCVHLAVVDPGVGSARHGLVVLARRSLFVGPDNGLFTALLESDDAACRAIDTARYARAELSTTFHGRDLFAPVAARLASGRLAFADVGPRLDDPQRLASLAVDRDGAVIRGRVVDVDHFGNLITNIGALSARTLSVHVDSVPIGSLVTTYADVATNQLLALVGSCGTIEVSVRDGSAAKRLNVGRGATVSIVVDESETHE
ncbi:MAG: SAM-dependent chlorinase/fluorinase [Myxococcales bacterium]|nr:SAM-dependent chlorinase/fluorinase [Myxococcales bacterium]